MSPASPTLAGWFFTTEPPGTPKIKNYCSSEDTIRRVKEQTEGCFFFFSLQRYLQCVSPTKHLYTEYIKNFYKSVRKRDTTPFPREKVWTGTSQKGAPKWPISYSWNLIKPQWPTITYHQNVHTFLNWYQVLPGCRAPGILTYFCGRVNLHNCSGKLLARPAEVEHIHVSWTQNSTSNVDSQSLLNCEHYNLQRHSLVSF